MQASPPDGTVWNDPPPAGCPFAQSPDFSGILFTGRHAEYGDADTWFPSWAADGKMYTPFTDGKVAGVESNSTGDGVSTTGFATVTGDDPLHLRIENVGTYSSPTAPYRRRYPSGSLVYKGVWYYGTYCLGNSSGPVLPPGVKYRWLGPFVGFRYSTDFGKTWTQTPCTPEKPLFGETGPNGATAFPFKIGTPHFVDFGQEMAHSPDGKAYLVAHGAIDGTNRRLGYNTWITGDDVFLLRVTPSIENINDASKYEVYAGEANGQPVWTHDFGKIAPIAAWRDHLGCATITYDAPLKKYLLCITDGRETAGPYDTMILESDRMTGPWKRVTYLKNFGTEAYFVNFPSKFISADGRRLWLCYSANFTGTPSYPPGSGYHLCLQEVDLSPSAAR